MSDLLLAAALVGSLFIISHPLSFVKRFFKSFLNFFRSLFVEVRGRTSLALKLASCDRRLCSGDFYIISHPISFVKRFFKSFLNFFQPLLQDPSVLPSR